MRVIISPVKSLVQEICTRINTNLGGETNPNKFSFLTPAAQCRAGFEPGSERRIAEQK